MPYTNDAATGDWEKLQSAFREVTQKFGSIDDVLEAFGLASMPAAQRYGILFGCIVFAVTVSSVIGLLVLGGSFKRIAEQSETGAATVLTASEARSQRALLLEQLLEGRERMARRYNASPPPPPPATTTTDQWTPLTRALLNEAPGAPLEMDRNKNAADENTTPSSTKKKGRNDGGAKKERYIPPFYQENYMNAYRKCQDKPGGAIISGRPEARYEAYARAFAGCGPYTSLAYRRSYARMYEAICCLNHANDDKYCQLAKERPHDIIGKYVRLEAMETERHLADVFRVTSGQPALEDTAYNPQEVWGFLEEGPFPNQTKLHQSFVFQRKPNEAGFAIVHAVTNRVMGVILLRFDDPSNLTIQLEVPIMPPSREGTKEQLESCFLLMDRLFAFGYRRIQVSIDSQDADKRKLCTRLGFTLEGCLCKHMVVKEASRDSNIYSMLNSDWKKGARAALFRKLYGVAALRADTNNEKKEDELDERERVLAEQKQAEQPTTRDGDKKKV